MKKILNKLTAFFRKNWALILVIIFSLFPLLLFEPGFWLNANEGAKNISLGGFMRHHDFYAWRASYSLGESNIWIPAIFIFDAFFYLFNFLSISARVANMCWYVFLWSAAGLSMYYLIKTLAKGKNYKFWAFFSCVLYLFNTFVMIKPFEENFRLVYIGLPLVLAFFIKGLRKAQTSTKQAILIGLSSLIFAPSSVNPPAVSIVWITVFAYFIFDLLYTRPKLQELWGKFFFLIKTFISYILFNFWWMLPVVPAMVSRSESLSEAMTFTALTTPLKEIFRFLGMWAFKAGDRGVSYFPYHPLYYSNPWVAFSSFAIIIIALSSLFIKHKDKFVTFFSILTVVAIFLAKGIAKPFGGVYQFMWDYFPGFWVFREPYTKFTPLVVFAVVILFGFSVSYLLKKIIPLSKKIKRLRFLPGTAVVLCLGVIFAASFPIFSEQIIRKISINTMKSQYFDYPEYWLRASQWFNEHDPQAKIIVTPANGYGAIYDWPSGFSSPGPVANLIFPNPILSYRDVVNSGDLLIRQFYSDEILANSNELSLYLSYLGVKYILQQNDLDWHYSPGTLYPPEKMLNILSRQQGLNLKQTFGRLDIYEVDDKYYLSPVYSPEQMYCLSNNTIEDLPVKFLLESNRKKSVFFVADDECPADLSDSSITSLNGDSEEIFSVDMEIVKISPDKYKISVQDASKPFMIVFSETFHPQWKVYIVDQETLSEHTKKKLFSLSEHTWFKKSISEEYHYRANGFANAWYIDIEALSKTGHISSNSRGGDNLSIILEFKSHRLLILGEIISIITFFVGFIYLAKRSKFLFRFRRKKLFYGTRK
jgi:hypothetical protein